MDSALLHFKRLRLLDVVDYETRALCLLSACIVSRTDSGTWARWGVEIRWLHVLHSSTVILSFH